MNSRILLQSNLKNWFVCNTSNWLKIYNSMTGTKYSRFFISSFIVLSIKVSPIKLFLYQLYLLYCTRSWLCRAPLRVAHFFSTKRPLLWIYNNITHPHISTPFFIKTNRFLISEKKFFSLLYIIYSAKKPKNLVFYFFL